MLVNQRTYVFFKITDSTVVIFQLRDKDLPQLFIKTIDLKSCTDNLVITLDL
jgi:hypothetical protein